MFYKPIPYLMLIVILSRVIRVIFPINWRASTISKN